MTLRRLVIFLAIVMFAAYGTGCNDDTDTPATDGDIDIDGDVEAEAEIVKQEGVGVPPAPADALGYTVDARPPVGTAPTPAEITAFTKKVTGFFKDTDYFNWVYRTGHGMHKSYNADMFDYRLWWQDVGMRKNGDTVEFYHYGRAENICKRTIKVIDNTSAAYLLTGEKRMAELAAQLMRGMVALSLGIESEREDPVVKYLQARAVFNHNHSYEVDGRKVAIDYEGMYEPQVKWNVHVFELTDNPEYGKIWISNMRSKDDVAYMYKTLPMATRTYYESDDEELRAAAELYIEYMRGFSQSIVDNDWHILTRYDDGQATYALDTTRDGNPEADLGSFVHWKGIYGPDAECNAQLGAAMAGYGFPADRGHCEQGLVGENFEMSATGTHYFNYNLYNYFHIAALATSQFWGYNDIAGELMKGLVVRFDQLMHDNVPNKDHKEYARDHAGWLLSAATNGYPLTAEEARHIMEWYGISSDWYRQWEHWDPWASMEDGEDIHDYKAPHDTTITDDQGNDKILSHVRLVEMPYIFEYCYSPLRNSQGIEFIDCDIVADPSQWGE